MQLSLAWSVCYSTSILTAPVLGFYLLRKGLYQATLNRVFCILTTVYVLLFQGPTKKIKMNTFVSQNMLTFIKQNVVFIVSRKQQLNSLKYAKSYISRNYNTLQLNRFCCATIRRNLLISFLKHNKVAWEFSPDNINKNNFASTCTLCRSEYCYCSCYKILIKCDYHILWCQQ